ncbi:hypothetical protein CSW14_09745 [Thermus scotoductus]|uniref:Uncharacterized protein n=1 Tax=Thermus scotoductus TaxID=37636 RepID=A0A430VJ51_THESC|nr:hypothetical protein CSW14_09745 [Thermus scotoductus]
MGGMAALSPSRSLVEVGVLARYGVELSGAKAEASKKGEDREEFQKAMRKIGLEVPRGQSCAWPFGTPPGPPPFCWPRPWPR